MHIGSERLVLSEGDDMILTCNTSRPVPVVWKWDVRPICIQCLFLFLIGLNPILKKNTEGLCRLKSVCTIKVHADNSEFDTVSIDDRAGTPNTVGRSSLSIQSQKVKQATMCAR